MQVEEGINILFVITLIGLMVMIGFMIELIIKTRKMIGTWSKVSDTLSDSIVRLIPAVLNIATIGKGIHEVLEVMAHHKAKKDEKK